MKYPLIIACLFMATPGLTLKASQKAAVRFAPNNHCVLIETRPYDLTSQELTSEIRASHANLKEMLNSPRTINNFPRTLWTPEELEKERAIQLAAQLKHHEFMRQHRVEEANRLRPAARRQLYEQLLQRNASNAMMS